MHVFYNPDVSGENVLLDPEESNHAVKVLRVQRGDKVLVLDGKGSKYSAEILNSHDKRCELKIISKEIFAMPFNKLHIAIAPTKVNDRMEWFLEKVTEMGVHSVTPIICDRSERRQVNHERFHKIILSAMKQSQQPWIPVLNEQISFRNFIEIHQSGFIAHCRDEAKSLLWKSYLNVENTILLIGPEGDFSDSEINEAIFKNWIPVSLGSSRLRTETAGVMACAAFKIAFEK